MQKTIRINLNEKELNDLTKRLDNWAKMMDDAAKNIVDDLSKYSAKKMRNIHQQSSFKSSTPMQFKIEGTEYKKTVSMSGEQALYEEFGTGTMGAMNPHPIKNQFDLKPYNSGRTIRTVSKGVSEKTGLQEGTLYWTYKDEGGQTVYTQGIPAFKPGYDSYQATLNKTPSIIKKRMSEVIKGA